MSKLRDSVRGKLLGLSTRQVRRTVTVTIGDESLEVELRSPAVGRKRALLEKLGLKRNELEALPLSLLEQLKVEAVLLCAYAPGDAQPLFNDIDRPQLEECDAGGWLDQLGDPAAAVLLGGVRSIEDAKKASAAPPSGDASSPSPSASDSTPTSSPSPSPSTNSTS